MVGTLTVTESKVLAGELKITEINLAVVTNSAGAFTTAAIGSDVITGMMSLGKTDPGSTAPSANYDIKILDDTGVDVFGGELQDRSATVSEQAFPKAGNGYGDVWVNSALSIEVANNTAAAATTAVKLVIKK